MVAGIGKYITIRPFIAIDRLARAFLSRMTGYRRQVQSTDRVLIYAYMSQLSILRILPLLLLANPLVAVAKDAAPLPMTLGKTYTGTLTPSPTNPQGEICYKLAVKPDTKITLKVKTDGVGIIKFAVYDKSKALRFFHNDVNNKPPAEGDNPSTSTSKFSFPPVSDASQLCLTTSNPRNGQKYDLTVTGKSKLRVRSRTIQRPTASPPAENKPLVVENKPTVAENKPKPTPAVETPPAPIGEPYCYVGTWQIADLGVYWLPIVQNFTQAKVTAPQTIGYAKITLNKDGYASFEAVDLEQRYNLTVKDTGAKIDRVSLGLSGSASARFQNNPDSTLTFNSQSYHRLAHKLNLGTSLKFSGDRLFPIFGDRDAPPVKLPYKCLDRDTIMLRVASPMSQQLIPILLKRVN